MAHGIAIFVAMRLRHQLLLFSADARKCCVLFLRLCQITPCAKAYYIISCLIIGLYCVGFFNDAFCNLLVNLFSSSWFPIYFETRFNQDFLPKSVHKVLRNTFSELLDLRRYKQIYLLGTPGPNQEFQRM